jgi:hypothetical protein
MLNTLKMIAKLGLVFLLMAGLQVVASAQGRGRGAGGGPPAGNRGGGPPSGVGVDRGIGTSSDRSNGRADTGRSRPLTVRTGAQTQDWIAHGCSDRTPRKQIKNFATIQEWRRVCIQQPMICEAGIKPHWRQIRI